MQSAAGRALVVRERCKFQPLAHVRALRFSLPARSMLELAHDHKSSVAWGGHHETHMHELRPHFAVLTADRLYGHTIRQGARKWLCIALTASARDGPLRRLCRAAQAEMVDPQQPIPYTLW